MSKDEKETCEFHLGLKACLQSGFNQEKQWSPGVRVTSPKDFDLFTDQLAQRLLETYPPEYIAKVAAQHIISMDELKSLKEGQVAAQDALIKAQTEKAKNAWINGTLRALSKLQADQTQKRMSGLKKRNARTAHINGEIKRHAQELWQNDTDEELGVTYVAEQVKREVERDYPGEAPKVERIKEIIREIAPGYARKPGRPRSKT